MIEIGTAPLGDRFIDAVRAALRDPDLALSSFSRADDGYVDAQGHPQVLPPRNDPREATALIRDGVLVGGGGVRPCGRRPAEAAGGRAGRHHSGAGQSATAR
ncbi:hypothetical protein ACVH9Z_11230 [Rhodococcus opacus]